ncbi:hypothetical protein K8W59_10360 [Nocardioides rotundus]|nr:hypothetical protein [Nocardioides rotundus]UAL28299.1 hypothetical protein K8W59_10360 [Nocardioides rotundus]
MDGQTPRFGVRVLQRVGQCLAVSALFLWVAAVGMLRNEGQPVEVRS